MTVAGFFSAAYGGSTIAPDVAPPLERLGLSRSAAETTALVVLTLLVAYLSLVLGELVPKRLALQKSLGISVVAAPVLDRFASLMRPVIWLLSISTDALVRLLGGDPQATGDQLSEEELRELVSTHDGLDEQERRILTDVFAATETTVKESMRPRADVIFLPGDLLLTEAAERLRDLPYSRYPVTGQGFDDVLGFLHVRDLLCIRADDRRHVADVCRPVLMLPGSKKVLPSVATMRQQWTHLAVVVDEYGGTDGIVTLEDLVEELIGEIRDEYDAPEPAVRRDGVPTIPGGVTLEEFARETGIELEDGDYETVAGYVMARLGRIPDVGDAVDTGGSTLRVASMRGNRVVGLTLRSSPSGGSDVAGARP